MTDWVEKVSRTHGKTYYYNRRTKKSTWKRPPELGKKTKQAPTLPRPTSPVWTEPPPDDLPTYECPLENATVVAFLLRCMADVHRKEITEQVRPASVVEVMCGSGRNLPGTLYDNSPVQTFCGIDGSDQNIHGAIRRCHGITNAWFVWRKEPDLVALTEQAIVEPVELIAMHFHFQRYCRTKTQVTAWFRAAKKRLVSKGHVALTMPSSTSICGHVASPYLPDGVSVKPLKKWKGTKFGEPYRLAIRGWLAPQDAYLCQPEALLAIANKCGFELVSHKNVGECMDLREHFDKSDEWSILCLFDVWVLRLKK